MARPITLFTGQWADLPLEEVAELAAGWGYDGLEIAVSGEHLDAWRWDDDAYIQDRLDILERNGLKVWTISNHLKGQAVCDDPIDGRHQAILSSRVWGDGDPEGVRQRAAEEMKHTARIAAKLGLPFVFAHHFHPHFTEPALDLYRGLFEPSERLPAPRTIVAAGIVVGDDDEDAARRALPGGVAMLRLRQGRPGPIPSVEDAVALLPRLSPAERAAVDEAVERVIVGKHQEVRLALVALLCQGHLLIEDLPGGRVRILTQESQIGQPAREMAAAKPNPMLDAHQDWVDGLARAAARRARS